MDSPSPRYTRTTDAVLRLVAGEHLLVPVRRMRMLDAETLYILDDVGAVVWNALAEPCRLGALTEIVADEFEVPAEADLPADLRALLDDLASQGLVRMEGPS